MLQIAPVEIALKLNQTNGGNAAGHERHELCQRIRKCERLRAASACVCECACICMRVCEGVMCLPVQLRVCATLCGSTMQMATMAGKKLVDFPIFAQQVCKTVSFR